MVLVCGLYVFYGDCESCAWLTDATKHILQSGHVAFSEAVQRWYLFAVFAASFMYLILGPRV